MFESYSSMSRHVSIAVCTPHRKQSVELVYGDGKMPPSPCPSACGPEASGDGLRTRGAQARKFANFTDGMRMPVSDGMRYAPQDRRAQGAKKRRPAYEKE